METTLGKNSFDIEISQLTCITNQLASFYGIGDFTESCFRTDYNSDFNYNLIIV